MRLLCDKKRHEKKDTTNKNAVFDENAYGSEAKSLNKGSPLAEDRKGSRKRTKNCLNAKTQVVQLYSRSEREDG